MAQPDVPAFPGSNIIRTDGWKWIAAHRGHGDELYDLKADPAESHNVAADPSHGAIASDLRRQLDAHNERDRVAAAALSRRAANGDRAEHTVTMTEAEKARLRNLGYDVTQPAH